MKIKQIKSQSRRDFTADYECEHCGFIEKDSYGYDDSNFHNNVIPKMKCDECGCEWTAMCFLSSKSLECPDCEHMVSTYGG